MVRRRRLLEVLRALHVLCVLRLLLLVLLRANRHLNTGLWVRRLVRRKLRLRLLLLLELLCVLRVLRRLLLHLVVVHLDRHTSRRLRGARRAHVEMPGMVSSILCRPHATSRDSDATLASRWVENSTEHRST